MFFATDQNRLIAPGGIKEFKRRSDNTVHVFFTDGKEDVWDIDYDSLCYMIRDERKIIDI